MRDRRLVGLLGALALVASGCGGGAEPSDDGVASAPATLQAADPGPANPEPAAQESAGPEPATSQAAVPALLDFRSETVAGEAFDATTLAGKPTVFWFWAPWCPTCRAQIAGVGELAETYGSEVNVVGVGSLDEREAIEEFAAEVSPDVTLLADPDGAVWRQFGVTAQSTYLVLDAEGEEEAAGYLDHDELAGLVEQLAG